MPTHKVLLILIFVSIAVSCILVNRLQRYEKEFEHPNFDVFFNKSSFFEVKNGIIKLFFLSLQHKEYN